MSTFIQKATRASQKALSWTYQTTLLVLSKIWELVVIIYLGIYHITRSLVLSITPTYFRQQKDLRGQTILVTGGAGGVGQELVLSLAKHKANVVVWDNNEKALEKVKEKIEQQGYKVHAYPVDISDKNNVYKYAEIVKADIGPVDILINNAGVVYGHTFLEIPDSMIEKTFNVNILSHYWTTKAFLPDMLKTGKGHIVTVGSLTGLLGSYKCVDYSATKYATIGFHESLLIELKANNHHDIHMTLICPYFINTGMFTGCKPKNLNMLEPKDVSKRIITAIKNEEEFVTIPEIFRFVLPCKNFLPAKLNWELVNRFLKLPQAMKDMRRFQEVEAA